MNDCRNFFKQNRLNPCVFETEQKEKILTWFSREDIAKESKEDFIKALINFDDSCGGFYRYRAFCLAAEALSQFPESRFADQIISQLLKWSYNYFRQDKRDWQIVPEPLVWKARNTLELTDKKRVIAAFENLIQTTENLAIFHSAVRRLGELDPGNKIAIAALVYSIRKNPHDWSCRGKISNLGEIAVGNQLAITALINFIEITEDKDNCIEAIISLGEIAVGDKVAIAFLVKFIEINQGDQISITAIKILKKIDPDNPAVIKFLVKTLAITSCSIDFTDATTYLLEIDPHNQAVIPILLEILENKQPQQLYLLAAYYLGKFELGNQLAISILAAELENYNSTNSWEYLQIAKNLVEIDPKNQQGINSLWHILQDKYFFSQCLYAANKLVKIGYGQQVINILCESTNSPDEYQSSEAISTLQYIDPNHPLVINNVIQKLKTKQDIDDFLWICWDLKEMDLANKLVQEKLPEIISLIVNYIEIWQEQEERERREEQEEYDQYSCIPATYEDSYDYPLVKVADIFNQLVSRENLPLLSQLITSFKPYLSDKFFKQNSYRYEAALEVIWLCAENMNYEDFSQAWHSC
jgi:hypothetical protein